LATGGGLNYSGSSVRDKYLSLFKKLKQRLGTKRKVLPSWPYHDIMMQINKDKPEIALKYTCEEGGVPEAFNDDEDKDEEKEAEEEEEERPRRARKRMRLDDCLVALMEADKAREREQKEVDRQYLETMQGIKISIEEKNALFRENGKTTTRLADALILSLAK